MPVVQSAVQRVCCEPQSQPRAGCAVLLDAWATSELPDRRAAGLAVTQHFKRAFASSSARTSVIVCFGRAKVRGRRKKLPTPTEVLSATSVAYVHWTVHVSGLLSFSVKSDEIKS